MKENVFYSPKNLDELVDVLKIKKNKDNSFLVAGATDLAVTLNKNKIFDYTSIDLTKIKEMKKIKKKGNIIEIGACVTMTELEESEIIIKYIKALAQAAANVGSTQIRNRATVGGNAANAAQCADTLPVLFAFNSIAVLLNSEGVYRKIKLEELIIGFGKTKIESDEVLVKFEIEVKTNEFSAFSKVGSRKTVTISKINTCMRIVTKDNIIKEVNSYIGSIGSKPIKSKIIENYCLGKVFNDEILVSLLKLGSQQIHEAIPTRSSRHYKSLAIKGIMSDVYDDIKNQQEAYKC